MSISPNEAVKTLINAAYALMGRIFMIMKIKSDIDEDLDTAFKYPHILINIAQSNVNLILQSSDILIMHRMEQTRIMPARFYRAIRSH